MGHQRRHLDQRLYAAEALSEREHARSRHKRAGALKGVHAATRLQLEADHAAEAAHLPPPNVIVGVRREQRRIDPRDLRVRRQPRGDHLAALLVPLHAYAQRLQAAQHEEAVHRPRNGAGCVLKDLQPVVGGRVVQRDHAHHHVTVAIQVLGHAVHDKVRAQLQRALEVGGRKGVVDRDERADLFGPSAHRGDVAHLEQRVGWGLQPH